MQISLEGETQDELLSNWDEVEPTLEADGLETDIAGAFAVYGDVNEITVGGPPPGRGDLAARS